MSEIDMMGMSFSEARHMVENTIDYRIALKRCVCGSEEQWIRTSQAASKIVASMMSDMQEELARNLLTPDEIRQRLNLFKFILFEYTTK